MFGLIYKRLRMKKPDYLSELLNIFTPRRSVEGVVTELSVSFMRTNVGLNSFEAQDARHWNSLPLHCAIFHLNVWFA